MRTDARPSVTESRAEAARLVASFDLDALARWAAREPRAMAILQRLLFDEDELIRRRSVEALAVAVEVRARDDLDRAREAVRRILWLMNDESGGVLWSGPEAIGAVLARVPALCPELGAILASFLDEEPFRAGTRQALWRLSGASPETVRSAEPELRASLYDADPSVRGHAALALRAAGAALPDLSGDLARFDLFDHRTGELRAVTVAEAAGSSGPTAFASGSNEPRAQVSSSSGRGPASGQGGP